MIYCRNVKDRIMTSSEMASTIRALLAPGKGLLAADESLGTIEKRFQGINLPSTGENHRRYRELLFTTPKLDQYLSGVILFDETIRQRASDGTPFVEVLNRQGIIPGIKVDLGAKPMAGFPGEQITEGLDGLRGRFQEYYQLGARFSKWRAVIAIGENLPTDASIAANANALARFAALSQEAGLVPIIEPEVLMDGNHTIERCEAVTQKTLHRVFRELFAQRVALEQTLLKSSMVVSGKDCPQQAGVQEVAQATVRCLRRTVVPAVPGIVFLSGGQGEIEATRHLNAINQLGLQPWPLSFSFARALQDPVLKTWAGDPAKVIEAQKALLRRARANSAAREGKYTPDLETAPVSLLPSPAAL